MDNRLLFKSFDQRIHLKEIMLGVRCKSNIKNIKKLLQKSKNTCSIYKMEMSLTEYKMKIKQ